MEEFQHVSLPNPGITISTLPTEIYQKVMEEISELMADTKASEKYKYNTILAGNIEHEFFLNKSFYIIKPFLEKMANEYSRHWNYMVKESDYELKSLWVNVQKKHEFNPLHTHNSNLSFVCWLQIPYSVHEELNGPHVVHSRAKAASIFQFVYSNIFGNIDHEDLYVDKDWAGRIAMFPAALHHQVYPFYTSDDYRISISGNLA